MTQKDASPAPSSSAESIVALVLRCQAAYSDWAAAEEPEHRSVCSEAYHQLLEDLWVVLANDLRQVARGWIRSHMAPDTESLALNMFSNIVFNLPKLQIDPARNVRNLLLTIARRGMIDAWRSHAGNSRGQAGPATSIDRQPNLIDPASAQIEEQTVQRIDGVQLLSAVWEYWSKLPKQDYQIMWLRWQVEPPRSFNEIAKQLGPGWTEATVRQRQHRIMHKTRQYLREQGLIDDNSDQ